MERLYDYDAWGRSYELLADADGDDEYPVHQLEEEEELDEDDADRGPFPWRPAAVAVLAVAAAGSQAADAPRRGAVSLRPWFTKNSLIECDQCLY